MPLKSWTHRIIYDPETEEYGVYEVHVEHSPGHSKIYAWGARPLIAFPSLEDAEFFFKHAKHALNRPVLNAEDLPGARLETIEWPWVFRDADGKLLFVAHIARMKDAGPQRGARFRIGGEARVVEEYAPARGEYEIVNCALVNGVWHVNIVPVEEGG